MYEYIRSARMAAVTNLDPAIYNLLKDPQEQERLRHYIEDTWVEVPLYRVLEEHEASIAKDPGIPDH